MLYTHPPEGSEGPVLPLKALSERFEVSFAEFGILRVLMRVGQSNEYDPPFNALKALLLMLARCLRRFLRLALEKPLILSLVPPPRHIGGLQ